MEEALREQTRTATEARRRRVVVGSGLLAVRDVAAWLKYREAPTGNPCAGAIRHAYALGMSESAHFLRHFLYLG